MGVRLITHETNKGKSFAVVTGIRAARNALIMLIDADLVHMSADDITALAKPVLDGNADLSISLRKNSLLIYKLIGLDFVSGERVFPRTLVEARLAEIEKLPGFGLEVFLNRCIIAAKLRVAIVRWRSVESPRKSVKMGFWKGVVADIRMIGHILKVVSLWEIIRQNLALLALARRKRA
jgi:glycosyltransferase involved in cell wall biosynthesis